MAPKQPLSKRRDTVFVIHGRSDHAREAVCSFCRAIGLRPLEWSQLLARTQLGSPSISELLDTAFREAVAVVVLLTGDDEAKLRNDFLRQDDEDYERRLTPQARQNVLFEAGLAFGRNPDRTVLVQIGEVRPFSDLAGRYIVRLDNSSARRQMLAERLRAAGCMVDTTGTDWHSAGNFDVMGRSDRRVGNSRPEFNDLSEEALSILRELASSDGQEATRSELQKKLKLDPLTCRYFLDQLAQRNLISSSPAENGESRVVLLLRGRDYLLNNSTLQGL